MFAIAGVSRRIKVFEFSAVSIRWNILGLLSGVHGFWSFYDSGNICIKMIYNHLSFIKVITFYLPEHYSLASHSSRMMTHVLCTITIVLSLIHQSTLTGLVFCRLWMNQQMCIVLLLKCPPDLSLVAWVGISTQKTILLAVIMMG